MQPRRSGAQHTVTARRPSKRSFTQAQARRLFAITMRTKDRALRQLLADTEQLQRYGLPLWSNEQDIADALRIELSTLHHFSMQSAQDKLRHYVTFAIPKRRGGERLIMAPKVRLKALQRKLNALLVNKLPVSEYTHGFRAGYSIRSNAQPHVGKRVVLRLDIVDFFGSLHFGRVRGLLLALGYSYPVAATLAALMTEAPRQPVVVGDLCYYPPIGPRACPQGAPTSPGLSNAVVVKMDRRLAGLARRFGFSYTRYADDLTFSGDDIGSAHALRLLASRVVQEEGFTVNADKTRVLRSGSRQTVTGVVVNDVLGLSRQERRRLRAAIHQCAQQHAAGTADRALHGTPGRQARLSVDVEQRASAPAGARLNDMIPAAARHPLVILAAALAVLPWIVAGSGFTWGIATEIAIFAMVGLGFNLLLGYTGLLSFGHGMFFGLAAYCTALTQIHWFPNSVVLPFVCGVAAERGAGRARGVSRAAPARRLLLAAHAWHSPRWCTTSSTAGPRSRAARTACPGSSSSRCSASTSPARPFSTTSSRRSCS